MITVNFAKNYLRRLGIRPTVQRIQLYMMLCEAGAIHLRIYDAHARLLQKGYRVSLATLYNNFKIFSNARIVRPVACEGYGMIFDTNTKPHHHIINGATGEIIDTDQIDYLLKENFPIETGHEIASVEITVKLQPVTSKTLAQQKPRKQQSSVRS